MRNCSNKVRTTVAVLMAVIVVLISYFIIVYGMLKETIEGAIERNLYYGLSEYYNNGNFDTAEKYFKRALFSEKYIVFWDGNLKLPSCYHCMGLVYEGLEKYAESADMYEKSLSAYEKYLPEDEENIALTHTKVSVIYSILGDVDRVIEHANVANNYYQSLPEERQNINAGTAALELANAYYNIGNYESASQYFEIGIPLLYNDLDWRIDDEWGPILLAVSYKIASETYGKLNNNEMQKYYEKEYNDILWIREIDEKEINELMEYFNWGIG